MKRFGWLVLCMACSTPKSDADWDGEEADAEVTDDQGASDDEAGDDDAGDDDEDGDQDAGDEDAGDDDEDGDGDDGDGGGGDEDAGDDDEDGDGDDGDDDDDGDEDDGVVIDSDDDGDADGAMTSDDCTIDALEFSVRVEDGDGPCASPCDKDDELTYYASVSNTTPVDCLLSLPSACLLEEVQVVVSGPHGGTIETYTPECEPTVTDHLIEAGGSVEESVEGGMLDYGNYVIVANFTLEGSSDFASTSIEVD